MSISMTKAVPTHGGWVRSWPRWAPYAAVAWSLVYALLGLYWAVSRRGFPYPANLASDILGPVAGRFGSVVAWIIVIMMGLPAAALGALMLRGVRLLRPFFLITGVLLTAVLLLLMTSLDLLTMVAYIPAAIFGLFSTGKGQVYLEAWTQWATIHQLLCLIGGFLWLAATVSYVRRSSGACLYCGRRDIPEGWTGPIKAARWGRIALVVAMVVPVFYAFTRYAWALGFPLGMSDEQLRLGQQSGTWIAGLSLATFGLVGAVLMLGLVQRWGEVFPRWMIGLAGRRVPIALAVIPASLASVLFFVGGIGIWAGLPHMLANRVALGLKGAGITGAIIFQVGPTLLFPVWGLALAVATLGYYYRRRGSCAICGRGIPGSTGEQQVNLDLSGHAH